MSGHCGSDVHTLNVSARISNNKCGSHSLNFSDHIYLTNFILYIRRLRRSEHGRILINLSVSLICLYVVFVIAGLVTSVEVLCGLVSALFQYFMLVFFGWTAAEAVFLYYNLAIVLGKPIEHFVLKAALVVWCKFLLSFIFIIMTCFIWSQ